MRNSSPPPRSPSRSARRARSRPTLETLEERTLFAYSSWAQPGADGFLVYGTDANGNRLPDFSDVGYQTGAVPLPDTPNGVAVPVRATLSPTTGDQTSRIQAAINQVSALPLDANGFRGALLLQAGEYAINGQLVIRASGVVLEGVGTDPSTGTRLRATGTSQRTLVQVQGSGSRATVANTTHNITDNYVPVGATSFTVDSTANLHVGDTIIVHRPSPANWIHDIGMDRIPARPDGGPVTQWAPGTYDMLSDRIVTAITGNVVSIDAPLTTALEQRYGGGTIYRYTWSGRLENVGIENIRGFSDYTSPTDENHSWTFINLASVENAWVQNVQAQYFAYSAVDIGSTAKWVTVSNAQCLDAISQITGGRRYSFLIEGQLNLVENAYARKGRHDFVMGARVPGPNVFSYCWSDNAYAESGPHQRWANGTLYDNVVVNGNRLQARNAGNEGTGHGWDGANMVFWNSTAQSFLVENPPTAQNWAIGDTASGGKSGNGIYDSWGTPVQPQSLYFAQLFERFGVPAGGVTTAVAPSANAYVYDAQPNANYGGSRTLNVKTSGPGYNRIAYLQLDLTGQASVSSVQLMVYGHLSGGSGSETAVRTDVRGADAGWDEYGVTWNTRPGLGGVLGSMTVTRTDQWFTIDVTAYVQAELAAGQTVIGFALVNPANSGALCDFNSIEATSNQPEFLVAFGGGGGGGAAEPAASGGGALLSRGTSAVSAPASTSDARVEAPRRAVPGDNSSWAMVLGGDAPDDLPWQPTAARGRRARPHESK